MPGIPQETALSIIQPTLQGRKYWTQLNPSLGKGLCAKGGTDWKVSQKLIWDAKNQERHASVLLNAFKVAERSGNWMQLQYQVCCQGNKTLKRSS